MIKKSLNNLKKTIPVLNWALKAISVVFLIFLLVSCKSINIHDLHTEIDEQIAEIDGDVAVAFVNLADENDHLLINADEKFHAASTMKVPVMIELFKQAALQQINLQDSIILKNEFKSIVDGSSFSMDISTDSHDLIYENIGKKARLYDLMYHMITASSNLATNVLIEIVDAKKVTETMHNLGAKNIDVLRGVEDIKAFDMGLSNSTTARDLMIIMRAIATNKAGNTNDCEQMLAILTDQNFNNLIPKYLPKDVKVAHKTGSITGAHHDAGIVYLPDGRSYVLVILSKNLKDFELGTEQLSIISKTVYGYMNKIDF